MVLVPQEGEQRPLQQAVGDESDEGATIRFCSATANQVRWALSQPTPTGQQPREDFRATIAKYSRPPSPRHPGLVPARAQEPGSQEQIAASALENPPAGDPGTGEQVSAVPSTGRDHPSDGDPGSPSLATEAQQPSASPPASCVEQDRASPAQPETAGDPASVTSSDGNQGPIGGTVPLPAANNASPATQHFDVHSDHDASGKEMSWDLR